MKYQQYKFNFYLNARHAIYINGTLGEIHPHTWEMVFYVARSKSDFVAFHELEKQVEDFMQKYQGQILNEVKPFDAINPTLENCANYYKKAIMELLNENGWILLMMEMSETPSRSYVISMVDEYDFGAEQTINTMADSILEEIENGEV